MNEKIYNKEGKELITLAEAEKLGLAQADTLKMRIHAKTLKAIKKGKTWFVEKDYVRKKTKN
ncbi:hypothetical protein HY212_01820 [Candidatus Pacearchaeota archaeon]|nr:hypothetical protein [Candidatus Pacearchaeota archaeon]